MMRSHERCRLKLIGLGVWKGNRQSEQHEVAPLVSGAFATARLGYRRASRTALIALSAAVVLASPGAVSITYW
jgi:hypothetical protein